VPVVSLQGQNTLNFKKFINCTFSQQLTNLNHLRIHVVIFNKQGIKLHYEFLLLTEFGFGKMIPVSATTCSAFIQPPTKLVHRALSLEISASNLKLTNSSCLLSGKNKYSSNPPPPPIKLQCVVLNSTQSQKYFLKTRCECVG